MTTTMNTASIVQEMIRARASQLLAGSEIAHDAILGADLGLDSIAIAELLLECQQRFGVKVAPLFDGRPLTLGRLVAHIEQGSTA